MRTTTGPDDQRALRGVVALAPLRPRTGFRQRTEAVAPPRRMTVAEAAMYAAGIVAATASTVAGSMFVLVLAPLVLVVPEIVIPVLVFQSAVLAAMAAATVHTVLQAARRIDEHLAAAG